MAFCDLADGIRLHYETFGEDGDRPAIVFLNGTAQTIANWRPLALRLKDRCRVILYDARCQGRSGCGAAPLTLARHADDLIQLLDHLAIDDAGLVGLSHGARVALVAAGRIARRIDGLMLLSLGLSSSVRMALALTAWRAALASGGLEALMHAMIPLVFGERFLREHRLVMVKVTAALVQRNDQEKMIRLLSAIDTYPSMEAILPAQRLPTLVLAGGDDTLVSDEQARALAGRMGGDYRSLPDIGHSIPAEAPDRLIREIDAFFQLGPIRK